MSEILKIAISIALFGIIAALLFIPSEQKRFWIDKPKYTLTLQVKDYIYKKPVEEVMIKIDKIPADTDKEPFEINRGNPNKDGVIRFTLPKGEYNCQAVGGYEGEVKVNLTADVERDLLVRVHISKN